MTTRELAIVDEITALGGYLVAEDTPHMTEDEFLTALVDEGLEDDEDAMRAALEDMGEDLDDWL